MFLININIKVNIYSEKHISRSILRVVLSTLLNIHCQREMEDGLSSNKENMMSSSLLSFTILLFILLTCSQSYSSATKTNILIIIVDDLRHLSDETINLPNIKTLAARGVNFKNAFAQVSF